MEINRKFGLSDLWFTSVILCIGFAVGKMFGYVELSWIAITSPLWFPIAFIVTIALFFMVLYVLFILKVLIIDTIRERKKNKMA